jgi:hypothetical protein
MKRAKTPVKVRIPQRSGIQSDQKRRSLAALAPIEPGLAASRLLGESGAGKIKRSFRILAQCAIPRMLAEEDLIRKEG